MIDDGETAEQAAARELVEESGYAARRITPIMRFHPEPAFTDHEIELFVGSDLERVDGGRQLEAEISEARFFSRSRARTLIANGDVASSWTIIALLAGFDSLGSSSTKET